MNLDSIRKTKEELIDKYNELLDSYAKNSEKSHNASLNQVNSIFFRKLLCTVLGFVVSLALAIPFQGVLQSIPIIFTAIGTFLVSYGIGTIFEGKVFFTHLSNIFTAIKEDSKNFEDSVQYEIESKKAYNKSLVYKKVIQELETSECFLEQNKGRYNIFYFLDLICAIYTYILLHLLSFWL